MAKSEIAVSTIRATRPDYTFLSCKILGATYKQDDERQYFLVTSMKREEGDLSIVAYDIVLVLPDNTCKVKSLDSLFD